MMNKYFAMVSRLILTLILLTWTKWRAPTNASKWRMGLNSAFKGLTENILDIRTSWMIRSIYL